MPGCTTQTGPSKTASTRLRWYHHVTWGFSFQTQWRTTSYFIDKDPKNPRCAFLNAWGQRWHPPNTTRPELSWSKETKHWSNFLLKHQALVFWKSIPLSTAHRHHYKRPAASLFQNMQHWNGGYNVCKHITPAAWIFQDFHLQNVCMSTEGSTYIDVEGWTWLSP